MFGKYEKTLKKIIIQSGISVFLFFKNGTFHSEIKVIDIIWFYDFIVSLIYIFNMLKE